MRLEIPLDPGIGYKSGCQITRRRTEAWAAENLYCVACTSPSLSAAPCNTPATDFHCPTCRARYQLKARRSWSERKVPDAAYASMIGAIRADQTPNLFVLQYDLAWHVRNMLLVPSFFFNESAVERRKPLPLTARRAGWIGCNILLDAIAPEGKIRVVTASEVAPASDVRTQYAKLRPIEKLPPKVRGWTLDVFTEIRSLGLEEFSLSDLYQREPSLAAKHPLNRNVRPKIRQQLQFLRDLNLLRFLGRGHYALNV